MNDPRSSVAWDHVTIIGRRSKQRDGAKTNVSPLLKPDQVTTQKRSVRTHTQTAIPLHKLESDEPDAVPKVSQSLAKIIETTRASLGLTRAQLGQRINTQEGIISQYERGTAVPDQNILCKLERALKVKLRGKDIGKTL
jgi:ribosome-binding protein aMBF1 (putative translation factor)